DADAYSGQASLVRKISIRLGGQTADAESSQLILRIVAGDDFKHTGSIFHPATQWPYARIQRRANHSITAHQFLRRRQSHSVVVLGATVSRSTGLNTKGHDPRSDATEDPEPPLEVPGVRVVSYGLQNGPPKELREFGVPNSPMFALARMIAPASRKRLTKVASLGGRSFA